MSSAGQALGGVVGAIGGFIFGGPTGALYGAQLGMGVGGLIDPPKGPNLQGPRLSDLSQQVSTYGAPIPRVYGTVALYGNVIWLQGDKLTEVSTTTESGGKGGPTSTQTTYAYYATFAVALCQGPIAGVRRIWIGADLYYDSGSSDVETIAASSSDLFTLYTGTDTQLPDPRIQADRGAANCSAYRGVAYIVFEDLPLKDHGNSLLGAQIKVEVVKLFSSSAPVRLSSVVRPGSTSRYHSALRSDEYGNLYIFHNNTDLYVPGTVTVYLRSLAGDETPISTFTPTNNGTQLDGWADVPCMATISALGVLSVQNKQGQEILSVATGLSSEGANKACQNCYYYQRKGKKYFVIEGLTPSSNWTRIYDVTNGTMDLVMETTSVSTYGRVHDIFTGENVNYTFTYSHQLVAYDLSWGYLWHVDMSSQSALIPITPMLGPNDAKIRELSSGKAVIRFAESFWEVDSSGFVYLGQSVDPLSEYDGHGGEHIVGGLYVKFSSTGYNTVYTVHMRPYTQNTQLLGDIVEDECLASGILSAGDLDVSALTSIVRGYRVANAGSLRAALTPLQGVFPFDVVQSGYQIAFLPRGGASVDSIPESDLGAGTGGPVPLFAISREMDTQLPRSIHIKYLDAAREYDIVEQYAERLVTDAVNRLDLDVAVVLTAAEAAQVAERLLYLYWLERSDIGPLVLPPGYRQLEPADVITVAYGAESYEVRLTGINYRADGCLECTGKLNSATIYTSTAVADTGEVTGSTLTLAGPTELALLDIPLLRDDDDTAGFPVAMGGYLAGWPGGVLYRSEDEGQSWVDVVASVSPGAVIGYATTSLAVHDGIQMDKASTLSVRLSSGSLASVTELQMFGGANWFAYGTDGRWEIIAAQTVALQGDGSYILSDFMRGQKGTAWASGLHVVNDRIVLLSAAALKFVSINTSSIGSERLYRGITFGKALDSEVSTAFTYTGINLECLSPVYLNGNRHPSTNDWTLTWIRRTRVGGEWRDYVDAALGESSESYEIDIFSDGTYTTLKRTLTATSQTVTYTSAQQVTDFGSNQATLYLRVYQLSATVGRGYALETSITR